MGSPVPPLRGLAAALSHPCFPLQVTHFSASTSRFPLPHSMYLSQLSQKCPPPDTQTFTSKMPKRCHPLETPARALQEP